MCACGEPDTRVPESSSWTAGALLVVSTSREAGLGLSLGVRADEVEEDEVEEDEVEEVMAEEDEAQVRGRPMLIKRRRSRVEFFMLRKSASGAGEPVGRGWRSLL